MIHKVNNIRVWKSYNKATPPHKKKKKKKKPNKTKHCYLLPLLTITALIWAQNGKEGDRYVKKYQWQFYETAWLIGKKTYHIDKWNKKLVINSSITICS